MFKEKHFIPVGGCTITYSGPEFLDIIADIIKFFIKPQPEETSQVMNFDWDGNLIYTPCDFALGANTWSMSNGHIRRYDGKTDENYATLTALKCGNGVIFGNGKYLHYSDSTNLIIFDDSKYIFDIESIVSDSKNGTCFFSLGSGPTLSSFYIDGYSNNKTISHSLFKLNQNILDLDNWDNYSIQMDLIYYKKDEINLVIYEFCTMYNFGGQKKILFFDPKKQKILGNTKIEGLQNICMHPVKDVFVSLGLDLSIWSYPDCQLIKSEKLEVARDNDYLGRGGVSFSSCGRFLAVTYAINGEVEIRDSNTLEILKTFEGIGLSHSDLSWDVSSRFIACRYYLRESGKHKIMVWEVKTGKIMLEEYCSNFRDRIPEKSYFWSPYTSAIAILQNQKEVKIFELVN